MNNSPRTYDCIIIGGGLAGLSAAEVLTLQSDARVGLVEARSIGSNKTTPMTFEDVVQKFGLEDHVIGQYRRFGFHSPLGNKSTHQYRLPVLTALSYKGACQALLERSQAHSTVDVLHATAEDLQRAAAQRWDVTLADGRTLSAPLVIDASGCAGFATKALKLTKPRMFSHCLGQRFINCPAPDPQEALFLAPSERYGNGGGWLYPLREGGVSFGYATLSKDPTYPAQQLRNRCIRALREFEPYTSWLRDTTLLKSEMGTIPIYPPKRFVYDGLLLVGDAAAQATIWSCMGVEAALVNGRRAGLAAARAHEVKAFSAATLISYQQAWEETSGRIYRQGARLGRIAWGQSAVIWNRQIPRLQELTSTQMLARLRTNWPLLPAWQVDVLRLYDLAGRLRRRMQAAFSDREKGRTSPEWT